MLAGYCLLDLGGHNTGSASDVLRGALLGALLGAGLQALVLAWMNAKTHAVIRLSPQNELGRLNASKRMFRAFKIVGKQMLDGTKRCKGKKKYI